MNKYEVIVEILGKKYKCKVEAECKEVAWTKTRALMCDKIIYIDANIIKEEYVEEVIDFDSIFGSMLGKLKPGQR